MCKSNQYSDGDIRGGDKVQLQNNISYTNLKNINDAPTSSSPNKEGKKSSLLLLLCSSGITSCYLWYGAIQEHVFHLDNEEEEGDGGGKESITLFLLATGTFTAFLLAWVWTILGPIILPKLVADRRTIKNSNIAAESSAVAASAALVDEGRLNHPLIIVTSITYLSAMAASNESLHYVSYPTCVLAKSSKLIPTMVVGWLLDTWRSYRQRRRSGNNNIISVQDQNNAKSSTSSSSINAMEWAGGALITIGILLFQYIQLHKQSSSDNSDSEKEVKGDSPYGLALLGLSLFMDGLMAGCQSTLKRKSQGSSAYRPPTAMETMLYINLYATIILFAVSHYNGQLERGIEMMLSSCSSTRAKLLFQLNFSASLGQVFIFLTIHHFSPLTCTTITTTRKFFTILLSVYKFGHVLNVWQWGSVGLVFAGLYLGILAKLVDQRGDVVVVEGGVKKKIE